MTTTEQKLDAARLELDAVPETDRHLFSNGEAIRKIYCDARKTMIVRLSLNSSGTPTNISNAANHALNEIRGSLAADIGTLAVVCGALDESEEYREAVARVQPLVDKITELETHVADEARAINAAENTLAEARAEALRKATEAAEHDPEVIAAKQALENGLGLGLGIKLETPTKPRRQRLEVELVAGV